MTKIVNIRRHLFIGVPSALAAHTVAALVRFARHKAAIFKVVNQISRQCLLVMRQYYVFNFDTIMIPIITISDIVLDISIIRHYNDIK